MLTRFRTHQRCLVLALFVTLSLMPSMAVMATELPTLGSEDSSLLWLGQRLGFPVRHLPSMAVAPDADPWLGPDTLDIQIFVTTHEPHAAHWHGIAEANGIGQSVFRLASVRDHAPGYALKLQLLALGCFSGRDDQALALWHEIITGQTAMPDGTLFARQE